MNFKLMSKNTIQKIIVALIALLLFNFVMPNFTFAGYDSGSKTWKEEVKEEYRGITDWKLEDYQISNAEIIAVADNAGVKYDDGNGNSYYLYPDEAEAAIKACNEYNASLSKSKTEGKDLYDAIIIANGDATEEYNSETSNGEYWDPEAEDGLGPTSLLIVPTVGLVTGAVDGIYKVFQNFILGGKITDAVPWAGNHIVVDVNDSDNTTNRLIVDGSQIDSVDKAIAIPIQKSELYHLPTMLLTPGAIFEGKVAALNANFFDPDDASNELGGEKMSTVGQLKSVISSWYITLRNIAIVGLLSVLIYIGIRIVISSSNNDKAKYKQFFMDWLVALCLIFFMHYIMSFMMTITDSITSMLASSDSASEYQAKEVLVQFEDDNDKSQAGNTYMYTSFAGVARMRLQYDGTATKLGYMTLYVAFVGYTVYFSLVYLKRILYLAFFTMIAPLVALTYPIDKMKDGRAQAFNFWFKEYVFYSLLQPLHLLLYTVFVSSAISLASKNMIYAIVAMAFIVPAEKIVKNMFGIKGQTENGIGGFAGGAVAGTLFSNLRKMPKSPAGEKGNSNGSKTPRIPKNPNTADGDASISTPKPWELGEGTQQIPNTVPESSNAQEQLATAEAVGAAGATGGAMAAETTDELDNRNQTPEELGEFNQQLPAHSQENTGFDQQIQTENNNNDEADIDKIQEILNTNPNEDNKNKDSRLDGAKKKLSNNALTREMGRRFQLAGGGAGLVKKLGKGAVKVAFAATGAAVAGAVGLGLGMVGGDLSDAYKGLATGAGAGAFIGNRVGNDVNNTLAGSNSLGSFVSTVAHGGYEEEQRRRARKAYITDRDNIQRIASKHKDFDAKQIAEYAGREFDIQYDTGVDNAKYADKALKMEDAYKNAYLEAGYTEEDAAKNASTIAKGALARTDDWSKSEVNDPKKREGLISDRAIEYEKLGYSKRVARSNAEHEMELTGMIYGRSGNVNVTSISQQKQKMKQQRPTRISRSNSQQPNEGQQPPTTNA